MARCSYSLALKMLATLLLLKRDAAAIRENVTYKDGDVDLTGAVFYPDATGPFPVVMHVHAWGGRSEFEDSRAKRTAEELGYLGFAVSIYDNEEAADAAKGMSFRIPLVEKYQSSPELCVSRLTAAADFIKQHPKADAAKIAAVGYCFGGTAVLQYARLGGATDAGVAGVVSFHGSIGYMGPEGTNWKDAQVLILNGAADTMIPKAEIDAAERSMTAANVKWEFTNYGHAGHGFTHPTDGTAHFHYDQVAEARSWDSMSFFLANNLGFNIVMTATNEVVMEEVKYMDGETELTGYFAYRSDASGTLPVVMHVHGWGGITDFEKSRALRTAQELGYIGFAVSIYNSDESNAAATSTDYQEKAQITQKYNSAPELFVSRLSAAVAFAKSRPEADAGNISAAGYCFGGSAVLQFARLGGASSAGVGSVVSFHGNLGDIVGNEANFCPTRVAVYNGAKDTLIKDEELVALQEMLEGTQTYWELTNYSLAGHGFTHPKSEDNEHFHFEKTAEARSWVSMSQFLRDSFHGKGTSGTCTKFVPAETSEPADSGNGNMQGDCMDDDAAVEELAGAWGIKKCAADLCDGQYKDQMQPLCKKTCGLCGTPSRDGECIDDDAAVEVLAGAWGVKKCAADLCEGQYKDQMQPLCKKTCGMCDGNGKPPGTSTEKTTDQPQINDASIASHTHSIASHFAMVLIVASTLCSASHYP